MVDKINLRGTLDEDKPSDLPRAEEPITLKSKQPTEAASIIEDVKSELLTPPAPPAPRSQLRDLSITGDRPNTMSLSGLVDQNDTALASIRRGKNSFMRGLDQGMNTMRATIPAVTSIIQGVAGNEEGAIGNAERAAQIQARGAALGPQTTAADVAAGRAGVGSYVAGILGSQAPVMASMIASAGIGGVAVRGAGAVALNRTTSTAARRYALKKARDKTAGRAIVAPTKAAMGSAKKALLNRSMRRGMATGSYAAGFGLQSGEAVDILLDEEGGRSVRDRAIAAGGGALATAGFEALPILTVFERMGLGGVARSGIMRELKSSNVFNVVAGGASQAVLEASTEVAQGIAMKAAHKMVNDNVELFSDEAIAQYIEEGIAGAIVGGALGGVTSIKFDNEGGAVSKVKDRLNQRRLETAKRLRAESGEPDPRSPSERFDQGQTQTLGNIVMESLGAAQGITADDLAAELIGSDDFNVALEVGTALRTLLDPNGNGDEVIEVEGVETTRAEAAADYLADRYNIDISSSELLKVAREVSAQTEDFQIDRLYTLLEERRAAAERDGLDPESEELVSLEQELRLRERRMQELRNEMDSDQENTGFDALDEGGEDALTSPTGDALEVNEPSIIAALSPFARADAGVITDTDIMGSLKASPTLGSVFLSPRTPGIRDDTPSTRATVLADKLNTQTGSSGQFRAVPAGDATVRMLRLQAGLDDSNTAVTNSAIQQQVIEEAQRMSDANPERAVSGERALNINPDAPLVDSYNAAVAFLNQFDTVVEDRVPGAATGQDPQRLTAGELSQRKIVTTSPAAVKRAESDPSKIILADPQGRRAAVDLVALTQTMINRVDRESRGGTDSEREARGEAFESGSGSGGVSINNVGRAVAAGLSELFVRNGYAPEGQDALVGLVYERNEIAAQGGDTTAIDAEIAAVPSIASVLNENATVFRSSGGAATSLGGATRSAGSQRSVQALTSDIRMLTALGPLKVKEQALLDDLAVASKAEKQDWANSLRSALRLVRTRITSMENQRDALRRAMDGKSPVTIQKDFERRIERLSDEKFKTPEQLAQALTGWPDSRLRAIRVERAALTAPELRTVVPIFPDIGSPETTAKDQAKAQLAADIAERNGGTSLFVGHGSRRSSTNLYKAYYGDRANTGSYGPNDAVFLSVEGNRGGSVGFSDSVQSELQAALAAGATVVTDARITTYNTGEAAAADFLESRGYIKETRGQLAVWKPGPDAKVLAPRDVLAPGAETDFLDEFANEPLGQGEFSEFFDVKKRAAFIKKRMDNFLKQSSQPNSLKRSRMTSAAGWNLDAEAVERAVTWVEDVVSDFTSNMGMPAPAIEISSDLPPGTNGLYYAQDNVIVLNAAMFNKDGSPKIKLIHTLVHELGHALEVETLLNASKEEVAALNAEYGQWRSEMEARLDAAPDRRVELDKILSEKRGTLASSTESKPLEERVSEEYVLDPREWFADNVARMIVEDGFKPTNNSLALRVFESVASVLKRLYGRMLASRPLDSSDTPVLRQLLADRKLQHSARKDPAFKRRDKPTTEQVQARLDALEEQEVEANRLRAEMTRLQAELEQAIEDGDAALIRTNLTRRYQAATQLMALYAQLKQQRVREAKASATTSEQRWGIMLEEMRKATLQQDTAEEVGQNKADFPGTDDTYYYAPVTGQVPPWVTDPSDIDSVQNEMASPKQLAIEGSRLTQQLSDAGLDNSVRVIRWSEATVLLDKSDDNFTSEADLQYVAALHFVKDGKVIIWINESMLIADREAVMQREMDKIITGLKDSNSYNPNPLMDAQLSYYINNDVEAFRDAKDRGPALASIDGSLPDDATIEEIADAERAIRSPFTIEGFEAMRSFAIAKLTPQERNVIASAMLDEGVRSTMIKFLRDAGIMPEQFLRSDFDLIGLGIAMHRAGLIELEPKSSKAVATLSAAAHRLMGKVRKSDQAEQILNAIYDGDLDTRASLANEAAKGSNLRAGMYALSSDLVAALADVIKSKGEISGNEAFNTLSAKERASLAADYKNDVFTPKYMKLLRSAGSDLLINPNKQFVLETVTANPNTLQAAAQNVTLFLERTTPMLNVWIGEAMQARFSGNATVMRLSNLIYTSVDSKGWGEAMFARKMRSAAKYHGQFHNIVANLDTEQQVAYKDWMLKSIKSKDPAVIKARNDTRKLMRGLLNYARSAGVPIGNRGQNYVPWVFDPINTAQRADDIIEDWMKPEFENGWKNLAREKGFVVENFDDSVRRKFITHVVNGIISENNGLVDTVNPTDAETAPVVQAMFKRELGFLEDHGDAASKELLGSMFSSNVGTTMYTYIDQLVKRAEYARTFGNDGRRLVNLKRRAAALGANAQTLKLMDNMADSAVGKVGLEVSPFWKMVMKPLESTLMKPMYDTDGQPFRTAELALKSKKLNNSTGRVKKVENDKGYYIDRAITNDPVRFRQAMAAIVVYQNIIILPLAMMTNVADAAGLFFRTGDMAAAFEGYAAGIRETKRSIKGEDLSELRKLGEELGIVERSSTFEILGQFYGGNMMSGSARRVNDLFFKYNGMEHLTRTLRLSAVVTGRRFIYKQAKKALAGDAKAIAELEQLDLVAEDVVTEGDNIKLLSAAEVDALLGSKRTVGDARAAQLNSPDANLNEVARDDRVKQALNRMVNESVLRPAPTQRPTWMNDPNWMLFSHLKGFYFTYHEQVLRRAYTQAAEGNYAPLLNMSSYVVMMIAMDLLRDALTDGAGGDDQKEDWGLRDYLNDGVRRSGAYGMFGMVPDLIESRQYGGSVISDVLGPTADHVERLVTAARGRTSMGSALERSVPFSSVFPEVPKSVLSWADYAVDGDVDSEWLK